MEKYSDSDLGKILENYEDQLQVVRNDENQISALQSKKVDKTRTASPKTIT